MSAVASAGVVGLALYAGHHVGDYWVQTDEDARCKGLPGVEGRLHCFRHVFSYVLTQALCVFLASVVLDPDLVSGWGLGLGLLVSGVTHYVADRREHGLMFRLARALPGKARFLELGVPRFVFVADQEHADEGHRIDNPTLGTGAWALDQSWHIFWGVFVATLIMVGLS